MLAKKRRIPRKMLSTLITGANVYRNSIFLLRFKKQEEKDSRFSFSVSKKIAKKAVIRNKIRRIGYRLLSNFLDQIKSNILAQFSFRVLPKNKEEIRESLEEILKNSKLIK